MMDRRYRICGGSGESAEISTFGATLVSLWEPDRRGAPGDVVLGYDRDEDYLHNPGNLGASIGRYANRIAFGTFTLNGRRFELAKNRGEHTIHGGTEGFHLRVWSVKQYAPGALTLELHSPDGDQGFPGNLDASVTFSFPREHVFSIVYTAQSDQPTVCSLTNHTYWNLSGQGRSTVDGHILSVAAEKRLETDGASIPTGRILDVAGTPFDFRTPRSLDTVFLKIGRDVEITRTRGLDHTYVLRGSGFRRVGSLWDPDSGRCMDAWTNQPSAQIYTAGNLPAGLCGKDGAVYGPHGGLCFETQQYPDAPNHDHFPSPVLLPGKKEIFKTEFHFGIR